MSHSDDPPLRLPTAHVLRAALHVANVLDPRGSSRVSTNESYWRRATGGSFPPSDLEAGEQLLINADLIYEVDGALVPVPQLVELLGGAPDDAAAYIVESLVLGIGVSGNKKLSLSEETSLAHLIPDPGRREHFLLSVARRWDDTHQRLVGEIGEELVVSELRGELRSLGRVDLARAVRRVSLVSDQLGYDVVAPRTAGPHRLIEVKASTTTDEDQASFFLSRNEAEVGQDFVDWSLVLCLVQDIETRSGSVVGWCPWSTLASLTPTDTSNSKWQVAKLSIRLSLLEPGLPRGVG